MSRTHIIILVSAIALLFFVLELVRRRRLREEYSWLWLLVAVGYLLVAVWPDLSAWVAQFVGATNPVSAFVLLGLCALILVSIRYSIQLSRLTTQNKDLAQQIAILDSELKRLSGASGGESSLDQPAVILQFTDRNNNLAQQFAVLDSELRRLASASIGEGNTGPSTKLRTGQSAEEQKSAQRADD